MATITTQTLIKCQLTAKKMKRKTHERHTCSSSSTAMMVFAKVPKDTTVAYAHAQLSVIKLYEMAEQGDTVLYTGLRRGEIFCIMSVHKRTNLKSKLHS